MLVKGTIYWAKILGEPQPGFDKSKREWAFDLVPDKEGLELFQSTPALSERLKEDRSDLNRGIFTTFKRKEFKQKKDPNGNPIRNEPIEVVGRNRLPWDNKVLIGNGSKVVVQFDMIDSLYGEIPVVQKILVLEHEPYSAPDEFGEYYDDTEEEGWDE